MARPTPARLAASAVTASMANDRGVPDAKTTAAAPLTASTSSSCTPAASITSAPAATAAGIIVVIVVRPSVHTATATIAITTGLMP